MVGTSVTSRRRRRRQRAYAGPGCPCCGAVLPVAQRATGGRICQTCGQDHEAFAFAPVTDPGPAVLPATADGTPCAQHARNAAVASCGRCGAFICQLCRIDSDGQTLCPGCFDRLAEEGALPSARRTWRDHGRESLMFGLVSALLWPLSYILGPAAIWKGLKGLSGRRRQGMPISKAKCIAGIVLGLIGTGIGILIVVLIVVGANR